MVVRQSMRRFGLVNGPAWCLTKTERFTLGIIKTSIRRIDTNGTITTIAGTGVSGYSGDGGLAINAQVGSPDGLAVHDNELYFVVNSSSGGFYHNHIRKIHSDTGTYTCVVSNAGGSVTSTGATLTIGRRGGPPGGPTGTGGVGMNLPDEDEPPTQTADVEQSLQEIEGAEVWSTLWGTARHVFNAWPLRPYASRHACSRTDAGNATTANIKRKYRMGHHFRSPNLTSVTLPSGRSTT